MSSVIAGNGVYGTRRSGRSSKSSVRIEKFFIRLIVFLVAVIILEIIFHFYISPSLYVSRVEISAEPELGMSENDILAAAGLGTRLNYFEIKSREISDNLLSVPSIKAVEIRKVFPSTVVINLTARKPVGVCLVESRSGTVPMAVDSEGVLFPISGRAKNPADYPVISGINASNIKNGARLPRSLCSFMEDLDTVRNVSPRLFSLISEVKFIKKDGLDYDVILYPTNSRVRVRIGNELDIKLLKYMVMILDVISMQSGMDDLEEIDLRTGEAVYRIRGE